MSKLRRLLFILAGLLFVGIAFIGIFVPGIPRTGPAIVASMCFAKTSPKLHKWLLNSKFIGPYLDNYYNKSGICAAYKVRMVTFMWAAMIFTMVITGILWLQIFLTVKGFIISFHIFKIKTKVPETGHFGFMYNMITILLTWIWFAAALIFGAEVMWEYMVLTSIGSAFTISIFTFALKANFALKTKEKTVVQ